MTPDPGSAAEAQPAAGEPGGRLPGAAVLAAADAQIRGLSPSYFALVMATGIVSIGAHLLGVPVVDIALLTINIAAYLTLWALTAVRLARHRDAVFRDLTDHQRGVGFLTTVAGTGVLGAEMVVIAHSYVIAAGLLIFAAVLWVLLTYTIFTALTIKRDKPSLAQGINGGWLLAVVATQAIAVLIALLSPHWHQPLRLHANFIALSMWLWGGSRPGERQRAKPRYLVERSVTDPPARVGLEQTAGTAADRKPPRSDSTSCSAAPQPRTDPERGRRPRPRAEPTI